LTIGVLALQGAFRKHIEMLERCGAGAMPVRTHGELASVQGLIIPGGESTTIGKLLARYDLDNRIIEAAAKGMPIYGTCAGLILLANEITGSDQHRLGILRARVLRNAFGRQVDSFEADLDIPEIGPPAFRAVFIRAPYIEQAGSGVEVLARCDDKIVLVRQRNLLASAFHPELTNDTRIHEYFVNMVRESR
jgi:5'-phosphate synthase pdxT subunit